MSFDLFFPLRCLAAPPVLLVVALAQVNPSVQPIGEPPVSYASVSQLNTVLSRLEQTLQTTQLDLAKLRIERWKTDGNNKKLNLSNVESIQRAVPLSCEQFRHSFANAVGGGEAKELYLGYSVPGAGEPLFQAASTNFNPWSETKVNSTNPERGPMLIVLADSDHTVPWAIANASYIKQKRNKGVTEIVKTPGRGHALTIDAGWREVAGEALEFVKRFT